MRSTRARGNAILALYEICGDKNASQVGRETDRNPQTVMEWVHRYNTVGPAALVYQHTGGRPPFLPRPWNTA